MPTKPSLACLLLLCAVLWCSGAVGQNLVPNPSFEEITDCPTSSGQIFRAPPWKSSWASPELYSECGSTEFSVPSNRSGLQEANSGFGYIGIACYAEIWHGQNAREFAKCTLNYALVPNEEYYVEFHVSQADSFQFATHNLGVTFTDVDTGEFGELLCWPDCDVYVENSSANPLSSKTEWMKVSGTFTAQGGERYIHIGNFRTDEDSEIEFIGGGTDPNVVWNQAYYYIDDLWLSHVDSAHYVGVDEELEIRNYELQVWPNPSVGGSVTVKCDLKNGETGELMVFDVVGRRVFYEPALFPSSASGYAMNVSAWPSGVYVVQVVDGNGNVRSAKLVRE